MLVFGLPGFGLELCVQVRVQVRRGGASCIYSIVSDSLLLHPMRLTAFKHWILS